MLTYCTVPFMFNVISCYNMSGSIMRKILLISWHSINCIFLLLQWNNHINYYTVTLIWILTAQSSSLFCSHGEPLNNISYIPFLIKILFLHHMLYPTLFFATLDFILSNSDLQFRHTLPYPVITPSSGFLSSSLPHWYLFSCYPNGLHRCSWHSDYLPYCELIFLTLSSPSSISFITVILVIPLSNLEITVKYASSYGIDWCNWGFDKVPHIRKQRLQTFIYGCENNFKQNNISYKLTFWFFCI